MVLELEQEAAALVQAVLQDCYCCSFEQSDLAAKNLLHHMQQQHYR